KVKRVIGKAREGAPDEILLVLDATMGQNAIQQALQFHEPLGETAIALTTLDGTAKGGVVIGIADVLSIPVRPVGAGAALPVLLFDVDGTLITTNGGARAAIERAFAERYGRTNGFDFPFDGMTDRAIVRRALERIEVEATEAEIDDFIAAYLSHLGEELDRA